MRKNGSGTGGRTTEAWEQALETRVGELCSVVPALRDYLESLELPLFREMPLRELPGAVSAQWLRDKGLTGEQLLSEIRAVLRESLAREMLSRDREVRRRALLESLTELRISGGHDKDGRPEKHLLRIRRGDTVCVTGTTGSGKTRLLEDIECLAAGDTPTGRTVLFNGAELSQEDRELLENRLCSYLSQTMNFVMELSCREFVYLHAECRGLPDREAVLEQVLACANRLAGEPFGADALITQLSGGQSRAFMIADLVHISTAPVVLIDEPENAGIDKHAVIDLLSGSGKMVLISTHEPVLALACRKRIVLKNGGISAVLERTTREMELLYEMQAADKCIRRVREALRGGEQL